MPPCTLTSTLLSPTIEITQFNIPNPVQEINYRPIVIIVIVIDRPKF